MASSYHIGVVGEALGDLPINTLLQLSLTPDFGAPAPTAVDPYAWLLLSSPGGVATPLSDPTIVNPTITLTAEGTYVLQILVWFDAGYTIENVILTVRPAVTPDIEFIASAVSPTVDGAPAATAVVPVPAGTLAGDFMLAFVSTNVQAVFEFPTCAGWTLEAFAASDAGLTAPVLYTSPFTPPNDPAGLAGTDAYQPIYVFSRIATGAEPADYTFSCATFADGLAGAILTYRGVDPVTPFVDFFAGGQAAGAGFNADGAQAGVATGVVAALAAAGTLVFGGANGAGGGPFLADSVSALNTRAFEDNGGENADSYMVQGVFDLDVAAGGVATQLATLYGRGNPAGWTNYQTSIWLVLAPAAPVPPAATTFTHEGGTNHELVYLVEASGAASANLDAPTLIADAPPRTPVGRFVSQLVPDQAAARKLLLGVGLDGEHTVKPLLIGEVSIQGLSGSTYWDLDVDDDGANGMRINVTGAAAGTANLRIRVKHTLDR